MKKVCVGCERLFSRTEYLRKHKIKCNQEKFKISCQYCKKSLLQSKARLSMRVENRCGSILFKKEQQMNKQKIYAKYVQIHKNEKQIKFLKYISDKLMVKERYSQVRQVYKISLQRKSRNSRFKKSWKSHV